MNNNKYPLGESEVTTICLILVLVLLNKLKANVESV